MQNPSDLYRFEPGADLGESASGVLLVTLGAFIDAGQVQQILSDHLVETDAPFLAPVPNRGKTCEPAFVADTAAFLAELRGEPVAELTAATTANFFTLFDKARASA